MRAVIAIEPPGVASTSSVDGAFLGLAARRHRARRRRRCARPHRGAVARRYGLPDLHLRHRRRAEGRHAEPPQHHRQLPRRLSPAGTARPRRRGVPVLSAAVAFLRAHRRADVPDLDRRRDLFRRGRRHAGGQSARSAPDDHDRGAAALRDDAPAHPPRHPARARPEAPPVRAGRRDRPQAPRRRAPGAGRAAARPGARPARARQGAGAVRRPAQGDGLGRRAAQPRDRRLLPGARRHVCCRATARPRRRR